MGAQAMVPELSFWLWFVIVVMVAFWTIDAWIFFRTDRATMSRKVVEWTRKYPLLPFFVGLFIGVCAGHFWQNSGCFV